MRDGRSRRAPPVARRQLLGTSSAALRALLGRPRRLGVSTQRTRKEQADEGTQAQDRRRHRSPGGRDRRRSGRRGDPALAHARRATRSSQDAAKQLGVSADKLDAALKKALENRVDAAVKAGTLTAAQGAELKQRIEAGELPLIGVGPGRRLTPRPPRLRRLRGRGHLPRRDRGEAPREPRGRRHARRDREGERQDRGGARGRARRGCEGRSRQEGRGRPPHARRSGRRSSPTSSRASTTSSTASSRSASAAGTAVRLRATSARDA